MMEEEIVKAALLGTERYMPELGLSFSNIMQKISDDFEEKEDIFLKQTALYYSLRDCCVLPIKIEGLTIFDSDSVVENNPTLEGMLQKAILTQNNNLLNYCLYVVEKQNYSIPNYILPDMLNKCQDIKRRRIILRHGGSVAKTIASLMSIESVVTQENINPEEGTLQEILDWISVIRKNDPTKIWQINSLQADAENLSKNTNQSKFERIFENEKVDNRLKLLKCLRDGLSKTDEPYLLKLLKTKSPQIKDEISRLLIHIEDTKIHNDYISLLKKMFVVTDKKKLMGLIREKSVQRNPDFVFDAHWKNYGFEELSPLKEVSDLDFQTIQVITRVPLPLIAKTLGISEEMFFEDFYVNQKNEKFHAAFIDNALNFDDIELLKRIIILTNNVELIARLPFNDALIMFENFYKGKQNRKVTITILGWIFQQEFFELSDKIGRLILEDLRDMEYEVYGNQYYLLGLYLPFNVSEMIQSMNRNSNDNSFFKNNHLIMQAIEDKKQIINNF
jgi:hypothetical protein